MKCQICKKNEASICMVKIIGNKKESKYICSECAKGMEYNLFDNISDLINPVFSNFFKHDLKEEINSLNNFSMDELNICPTCGQTERQREESQRMGCSDCYKYFKLSIKKYHVGKIPKSNKQSLYVINLINKKEIELQKLLKKEQYEQAAVLRDEIKTLKKEMENEI